MNKTSLELEVHYRENIKYGEADYRPNQEQAKTYYNQISFDDKSYSVDVRDEETINNLFKLAGINMTIDALDKKDCRLLMSIHAEDCDRCMVTYYFHQEGASAEHRSISNSKIISKGITIENYKDFINDDGNIKVGGFEDWEWTI